MTDLHLGIKKILLYWNAMVLAHGFTGKDALMPTIFVRLMLFVSSYFPLTVIFWILFVVQQPVLAWSAVIIGSLGLLLAFVYFFKISARMAPVQGKISERQEKGSDVMGYIASYIVPFATFPLNGWQQIAALFVFMIVLGIVYVNSEMIRVNPILNLIGYHLYEITVEHSDDSVSLITRRHVRRGEIIRIVDLGRDIFLEKTT